MGLCTIFVLVILAYVLWKTFFKKENTNNEHNYNEYQSASRVQNRKKQKRIRKKIASPVASSIVSGTSAYATSFISSVASIFDRKKKRKKGGKVKRLQQLRQRLRRIDQSSQEGAATSILTEEPNMSSPRTTVREVLERHRKKQRKPVANSKMLSSYLSSWLENKAS